MTENQKFGLFLCAMVCVCVAMFLWLQWKSRTTYAAGADFPIFTGSPVSTAEAVAAYQDAMNRTYGLQPFGGFVVAPPHPVLLLRNRRRVRVPLRLIRR